VLLNLFAAAVQEREVGRSCEKGKVVTEVEHLKDLK